MLLEATLVGEDLVAEVAALLLAVEQQPEEEAVDPAHEARQVGAAGEKNRGVTGPSMYHVSCVQARSEFFSNQILTPHSLSSRGLVVARLGQCSVGPGRNSAPPPGFISPFTYQ